MAVEQFNAIVAVVQLIKDCFRPPKTDVDAIEEAFDHLKALKEVVDKEIDQRAKTEAEVATSEAKEWLRRLDKIGEEANEIINSYNKFKCLFCFSLNCLCLNISTPTLKEQLDNLIEEKKTLKVTEEPAREAVKAQGIPQLFGDLQPYLAKVAAFLANNDETIMGIHGLGGSGKTTLMKVINNELIKPSGLLNGHNNFDCVIWAVGSKKSELQTIQEKIVDRLQIKTKLDGDLASHISKYLKNTNFLLLLDDLWEHVKLEDIGIPVRQHANNKKGKVIITTRSEDVCADMGIIKDNCKIKMGLLEHKDAMLLFKAKFGEVISDKRLQPIAESIVEECDGLPLALETIGRAMATKTTLNEWKDALKSLRDRSQYKIVGNIETELLLTLKLSYDYLADDTQRQCFMSCAMWPKDYIINEDELIWYWIGHGLLDIFNDIDKAFRVGRNRIRQLVSAALLELVDDEGGMQVTMHDVIRDIALWIANGEGKEELEKKWIVIEDPTLRKLGEHDILDWQEAERISLAFNQIEYISCTPYCPKLFSLTLRNNVRCSIDDGSFFQKLASLYYLDLSGTNLKLLPNEIGSLCNLIYLNVSRTGIIYLPEMLKNLVKLKFLIVRENNGLEDISDKVIPGLFSLVVLDLFACSHLSDRSVNAVIEKLINSTTCLRYLGICVYNYNQLQQLSRIPRIFTRSIELYGARTQQDLEQVIRLLTRPNLNKKLQHLKINSFGEGQILKIGDANKGKVSSDEIGDWVLQELEYLEFLDVQIEKIVWEQIEPRSYLPKIRKLEIKFCNKLENISWVAQLRSLEHLEVVECASIRQIVKEEDEVNIQDKFPFLRRLVLTSLQNLESICDQEYAFPSLKLLDVSQCDSLRRLPFSPYITNNNSLTIRGRKEWFTEAVVNIKNEDVKIYLQKVFLPCH